MSQKLIAVLAFTLGLPGTLAATAATGGWAGVQGAQDLEANTSPSKKRIVICLDGTWNNPYKAKKRYDEDLGRDRKVLKPTNVLKTCRAVLPRADGVRQLTYYDIGVGALNKHPGIYNRLLRTADSVLGGAWGAGFETRIEDAHRFLVHNYEPGDEVFVFGFSRGAAAARGLTRFIEWMGGLPAKDDAYYSPLFFRAYEHKESRLRGPQGVEPYDDPDFQIVPMEIKFLGVWDTVLALGSRLKRNQAKAFHLGSSPSAIVRTARQSLAVDERRFDFLPDIWTRRHPGQSLEQRWYAGVHSNIGGGYALDGLANLTLAWMLSEAEKAGLGLDWGFLFPYRPYPQAALYDSRRWFYRFKETVAFRRGRGIRALVPKVEVEGRPVPIDVAAAGLSLDCSVLQRLASQPSEHEQMTESYGPSQKSLIRYLSTCNKHDEWLNLDLRRRVEERRGGDTGLCLDVAPTVFLSRAGPTLPNPDCRLPDSE